MSDLRAIIRLPASKVTESWTDPIALPCLIPDLPAEMMAALIGGGSLRAEIGGVEIPIDASSPYHIMPYFVVQIPTATAGVAKEILLTWVDQPWPAATSPNGRNAVWSGYAGSWSSPATALDVATDRTGKGNDLLPSEDNNLAGVGVGPLGSCFSGGQPVADRANGWSTTWDPEDSPPQNLLGLSGPSWTFAISFKPGSYFTGFPALLRYHPMGSFSNNFLIERRTVSGIGQTIAMSGLSVGSHLDDEVPTAPQGQWRRVVYTTTPTMHRWFMGGNPAAATPIGSSPFPYPASPVSLATQQVMSIGSGMMGGAMYENVADVHVYDGTWSAARAALDQEAWISPGTLWEVEEIQPSGAALLLAQQQRIMMGGF